MKKNYVCRNISELYKQDAVVAALKNHPILEQDFSHSTWKSYSKYQKIALVKKLIVAFSKLNDAHLNYKQNNNLSKNGDFTKHVIEYINDSAAPTFLTQLQEYICKLEVLNDTDSKMGFHKIFPPEVLRCLKGPGDRLEKDAINPLNRKINFISNEHPFITTLNDTLSDACGEYITECIFQYKIFDKDYHIGNQIHAGPALRYLLGVERDIVFSMDENYRAPLLSIPAETVFKIIQGFEKRVTELSQGLQQDFNSGIDELNRSLNTWIDSEYIVEHENQVKDSSIIKTISELNKDFDFGKYKALADDTSSIYLKSAELNKDIHQHLNRILDTPETSELAYNDAYDHPDKVMEHLQSDTPHKVSHAVNLLFCLGA